jgi:hypothetical protein
MLILKDTEAGNLLGKVICVCKSVLVTDAEQDQQSRSNVTGNLVANANLGPRHSLHYGAHNVLFLLLSVTNAIHNTALPPNRTFRL